MSIKRGTQVKRGTPRQSGDAPSWATAPKTVERKWNWAKDAGEQPDEAFVAYAMTGTYAVGTLLNHAKFGKGVVTGVDGQNIDVLFEPGAKRLRHTPAA